MSVDRIRLWNGMIESEYECIPQPNNHSYTRVILIFNTDIDLSFCKGMMAFKSTNEKHISKNFNVGDIDVNNWNKGDYHT